MVYLAINTKFLIGPNRDLSSPDRVALFAAIKKIVEPGPIEIEGILWYKHDDSEVVFNRYFQADLRDSLIPRFLAGEAYNRPEVLIELLAEVYFSNRLYLDLPSTSDSSGARKLRDFAYSLTGFNNEAEATKAFEGKDVVELSMSDFNTLVEGRIFWARTAVGIFLNQLPLALQNEFIDEEKGLAESGYQPVWNRLKTHIRERVFNVRMLTEGIKTLLSDISWARKDTVEKASVGLQFELLQLKADSSKSDRNSALPSDEPISISDLHKQLDLYYQAVEGGQGSEMAMWREFDDRLNASGDSEDRFSELFKGQIWQQLTAIVY